MSGISAKVVAAGIFRRQFHVITRAKLFQYFENPLRESKSGLFINQLTKYSAPSQRSAMPAQPAYRIISFNIAQIWLVSLIRHLLAVENIHKKPPPG